MGTTSKVDKDKAILGNIIAAIIFLIMITTALGKNPITALLNLLFALDWIHGHSIIVFFTSLAIGAFSAYYLLRQVKKLRFYDIVMGAPIFIRLLFSITIFSATLMVEIKRNYEISVLKPEKLFKNSLWSSLSEATPGFFEGAQFFLHAGAMKQCVPYAWSYETMTFYKLDHDTARNVLPEDWLKECGLRGWN